MDARLPLIARLTLVALGAVAGGRARRPLDPVAAWLLRGDADLQPAEHSPAAHTTIRARTSIVDGLLAEEVERARVEGSRLAVWSVGGGFDARWYRLLPLLSDVVKVHREVEEPDLISLKTRLLNDSPYAALWRQVDKRAARADAWAVEEEEGTVPLVILEGLAGRLDPDALIELIDRVRATTPRARVIIGLPALSGRPKFWSERGLHERGWRVCVDIRLAPRGRLVARTGKEICAGMHGLRLLRLEARS